MKYETTQSIINVCYCIVQILIHCLVNKNTSGQIYSSSELSTVDTNYIYSYINSNYLTVILNHFVNICLFF